MSELLQQGKLEPVAKVANDLTGERPSRQSIWRWMRKGVAGGVKLEAVHLMNTWRTTEAAFRDFLERQSEARLQPRETVSATDEDLQAAGLL